MAYNTRDQNGNTNDDESAAEYLLPSILKFAFFINKIFGEQLFRYRTSSNLLLRTPYQIMQYIEQRFPAIMGRI
jgi:hypothetical protein